MNWGKIAGIAGVVLTYTVYSVALYFFVYRLGWRWFWTTPNWSAAIILYPTMDILVRIVMGMWCHAYAWLGDAGITSRTSQSFPPPSLAAPTKAKSICRKCLAKRPARTHHCSTCNACIYQMDHHCPWINNCVGLGNQKAFLLFLAYTSSAAIECLGLAGLRLITCPNIYRSAMVLGLRFMLGESRIQELLDQVDGEPFRFEETCDFTINYFVSGILGIIFAGIFSVFIAFIASDQIRSIVNNETYIESLKRAAPNQCGGNTSSSSSTMDIANRLKEVMGSNPGLYWLVPMRKIDWRSHVEICGEEASSTHASPKIDDACVGDSIVLRGS